MHRHNETWPTIEGNHLKFWKSIIFQNNAISHQGLLSYVCCYQMCYAISTRPGLLQTRLLCFSHLLLFLESPSVNCMTPKRGQHQRKNTKIWGMLPWNTKMMTLVASPFQIRCQLLDLFEDAYRVGGGVCFYQIWNLCKNEKNIFICNCRYMIRAGIFSNHRINQWIKSNFRDSKPPTQITSPRAAPLGWRSAEKNCNN